MRWAHQPREPCHPARAAPSPIHHPPPYQVQGFLLPYQPGHLCPPGGTGQPGHSLLLSSVPSGNSIQVIPCGVANQPTPKWLNNARFLSQRYCGSGSQAGSPGSSSQVPPRRGEGTSCSHQPGPDLSAGSFSDCWQASVPRGLLGEVTGHH